MGLQDVFFQMRLPFDAPRRARCRSASPRRSTSMRCRPPSSSRRRRARTRRSAETRAARGELQFDAWDVVPERHRRAGTRCARASAPHGLRNSLLVAIAPTATIASIAGCYECIEPQVSNLFKRETLSGDFLQVNRYLVAELKELGLWNEATRARLKLRRGLGAGRRPSCRRSCATIYRTAWEIPMRSLIDMAADRGAFIDQSQSLNLFVESPNIGQLSSACTSTRGRGASRRRTTCARAPRRGSPRPPSRPDTPLRRGDRCSTAGRPRRRVAEPGGRHRVLAREPRDPARPANERRRRAATTAPARSRPLPHAAADGVPARSSRCTVPPIKNTWTRRGGRLLHRRRRPAAAR